MSKQAVPITNSNGTAKPAKKRALEQSSGGETGTGSSSGEEDASRAPAKRMQSASQARKKRRNVLPAIPKNQRCGTCRTCLNPQVRHLSITFGLLLTCYALHSSANISNIGRSEDANTASAKRLHSDSSACRKRRSVSPDIPNY